MYWHLKLTKEKEDLIILVHETLVYAIELFENDKFFFFINTRHNLSFGLKFAKDTRKLKMFKSDAVDII